MNYHQLIFIEIPQNGESTIQHCFFVSGLENIIIKNHSKDIIDIILSSTYKNKLSKDASARKLVYKYHIVTSQAVRLFKLGLQYRKEEELNPYIEQVINDLTLNNQKIEEQINKFGYTLNEKYEYVDKDGVVVNQKRKLTKY